MIVCLKRSRCEANHQARRKAFTLVELVTVIIIVAVLVALLLPAIQQARDSSRGTLCRNNFKQLSWAIQNYHDVFGCFPAGIDYSGDDQFPVLWSWRVALLPYLDQKLLYDELNLRYGIRDSKNQELLTRPMPFFYCPMDPYIGKTKVINDGATAGTWGTASYFGVSGNWGLITAGNGNLLSPDQCSNLNDKFSLGTRSGVLYENSWVQIRDITDGTSSTLMIGERGIPKTQDSGWFSGPGLANACPGGWTDAVLPFVDNFGLSGLGPTNANQSQSHRWWSNHEAGGVFFASCDGSVKFYSYETDAKVMNSLSTRSGGEKDVP